MKEDIFLRNVQHINVSIDMNLEGKVRKKRIEQQFEGDKTFHEDEENVLLPETAHMTSVSSHGNTGS